MNTIRELFWKKIDRKIEEVIKVDQADEQTVQDELEEYIATDSIKEHFCTVYQAMADAPAEPHEGIGVWVSGFFGSGKSSFAKILGYTVAAREVGGKTASQFFKENLKDRRISDLLDFVNTRIPTHAIIFDVSMDRGVRTASGTISTRAPIPTPTHGRGRWVKAGLTLRRISSPSGPSSWPRAGSPGRR